MRYLAFVLIPLILLACNKSDQQKSLASLPAFTCDDSTDDGKFELWDGTVQNLIFQQNPHLRNPDSVVPGYMLCMDSAVRVISLAHPEFRYRAVYDSGVWWFTAFGLVDAASGQVEAWGFVDRGNGHAHDTVMEHADLSPGISCGLSAGCKRLYYYGFKEDTFYNGAMLVRMIPGKVLFKGHYDVQVY